MVKARIFSVLFTVLFITHHAQSQCTPNATITQPGIYPDTLPVAIAGSPYFEVIQIKVPVDTVFQGNNATITNITVTGMLGLPTGFSYACNPANCVFPGGSNGCAVITGNPSVAQIGQYPLRVTITITGNVVGIPFPITIPDTVDKYTLVISQSTGLQLAQNSSFEVRQNFPNPATAFTNIDYMVPRVARVEFRLFDVLGKELESRTVNAKPGANSIRLDSRIYEPGIYMYSLKFGDAVVTRRMVIGKK